MVRHIHHIAVLAMCLAALAAAHQAFAQDFVQAEGGLRPRHIMAKPARTTLDLNRHEAGVILVKFRDDLPVRLRDGALSDLGTSVLAQAHATLAQLAGGQWQRWAEVPEDRLDAMRQTAQARTGREIADMNTYFHFVLAPGMDAGRTIDLLNTLDVVELAEPAMKAVAPPLPPNFQSLQGYLSNAVTGIGAFTAWSSLGTRGEGVTICDIEYLYNTNHQDIDVTTIGPTPQNPPGLDLTSNQNHGTAVFGVMGSLNNGWGTTGIASDAEYLFAAAYYNNAYNLGGAILTATNTLDPGDIMVIEQQTMSASGLVPVEWWQPWHQAISLAVGNGIHVVEAAGNGGQNLNSGSNAVGSHNHFPFISSNDSGAIIVGAGAAPFSWGGSDIDRSRLGFSTYGTRVNLQGWGEAVFSTGYGNYYSAEGPNYYYVWGFTGTSAATPIVAGAVALLQSAYLEQYGEPVDPLDMRAALEDTGSPQQAGTYPVSQNIGPRPNVLAAWEALVVVGDLNGDGVVDAADRAIFCAAMGSSDGQPGFVEAADLNNDGDIDHFDLALFNNLHEPCIGDVVTNATLQPPADDMVDGADLAYLLGEWGPGASCADFVNQDFVTTPDGMVGGADLAVLLGGWGGCP